MPPERRRVPGHGAVEPVLAFVGEAPGRFGGDRTGVPFSGDRSGQFLRELIAELAATVQIGAPRTLDQYAKDVAAFLMWAAEPHLEARKRIGFQVMIFLVIFGGLMYFTKKKVWAEVH